MGKTRKKFLTLILFTFPETENDSETDPTTFQEVL